MPTCLFRGGSGRGTTQRRGRNEKGKGLGSGKDWQAAKRMAYDKVDSSGHASASFQTIPGDCALPRSGCHRSCMYGKPSLDWFVLYVRNTAISLCQQYPAWNDCLTTLRARSKPFADCCWANSVATSQLASWVAIIDIGQGCWHLNSKDCVV